MDYPSDDEGLHEASDVGFKYAGSLMCDAYSHAPHMITVPFESRDADFISAAVVGMKAKYPNNFCFLCQIPLEEIKNQCSAFLLAKPDQ